MRLTKRKGWIAAVIGVPAVLVWLLLSGEGDQITVHVVDKQTGKQVSAFVSVREFRDYPILSGIEFLPGWLRYSDRTRYISAANGTFKMSRTKKPGHFFWLRIRGQGPTKQGRLDYYDDPGPMEYFADTNGSSLIYFDLDRSKAIGVEAKQKEVSVPVERPLPPSYQ